MASTVVSESKVHPRLSLSLEPPASASPFPSPSSSFLPPPMPGAHEFAVKPPPGRNPRTGKGGPAHASSASIQSNMGTPTDVKPPRSALSHSVNAAGEITNAKVNGSAVMQHSNGNGIDLHIEPESPCVSPITPTPSMLQMHSLANGAYATSSLAYPPTPAGLYPPSPSDERGSALPPAPSSSAYPPSPVPGRDSAYPPTPTGAGESAYPPTPVDTVAPTLPVPIVTPATPMTGSAVVAEPPAQASITIPSPPLTPMALSVGPTPTAASILSKAEETPAATPTAGSGSPQVANASTSVSNDASVPGTSVPRTPSIHRLSLSGLSTPDPTRPAPPSPALSRRTSQLPPGASNPPSPAMSRQASQRRAPGSRPVSGVFLPPSRQNSIRRGASGGSPSLNPKRQSTASAGGSFSPLPSPQSTSFPPSSFSPPSSFIAPGSRPLSSQFSSTSQSQLFSSPLSATQAQTAVPIPLRPVRTPLKVRDFGFPVHDERHVGLGPDVPKANRVGRLNRRLGVASPNRASVGSWTSSDGDGDADEDEEGEGGWDGFRMGMGKFAWNTGWGAPAAAAPAESHGGFPTQDELTRNFLDDNEVYYYDDDEPVDPSVEQYNPASPGEFNEEEEPLYPGLYRALYAFEPEGTAEMGLEEDQVVRVVGRGGGVGWAVVVDERGGGAEGEVKHALVPESYLEVLRLDGEDDE